MKSTEKNEEGGNKHPPFLFRLEDNLTYYHYFFLSLISLLLLVNILFQKGVTNFIIKRAWGIDNFSYFPWWIQAFVFILLFALAVPSINNSVRLFIQKIAAGANRKTTGKSRKIIWFTGISLFISLLFYLFRVKYDLLGDMNLRVSQTMENKYISDEYLTMFLMHQFNFVLQKFLHFIPHQTFVFASIAAGFFFCLFGLLIADLLFEDIYSLIIFFLFYISPSGYHILKYSVTYLYQASLARNDTATNRDSRRLMKQLHFN